MHIGEGRPGGDVGRTVEVLLTVGLALVVSVLGLFDIVDRDIVAAATLTMLALLALDLSGNRRQVQRLDRELRDLGTSFERVAGGPPEQVVTAEAGVGPLHLDRAMDIRLVGVTLNRTVRSNLAALERRLAAGASVRIALIEPDGAAAREAARRNGLPDDAGVFEHRLLATIDSLRYLYTLPGAAEHLQVRFLSFVPAFGLTLIDPGSAQGAVTADIYSHHPAGQELAIALRAGRNLDLHQHFSAEFDRIWQRGRPAQVRSEPATATRARPMPVAPAGSSLPDPVPTGPTPVTCLPSGPPVEPTEQDGTRSGSSPAGPSTPPGRTVRWANGQVSYAGGGIA